MPLPPLPLAPSAAAPLPAPLSPPSPSSAADGGGTPTAQRWTALHYAAKEGHDDCVDLLVEKKANLNEKTVSAGPRASDATPPVLSACRCRRAPRRMAGGRR